MIELLTQLKGLKFVTTLVLVFKKIKTKYENFYSSSKAEIIANESDTVDAFQSIYTTIITNKKIFRKRFRLDYWFSHWSYYYRPEQIVCLMSIGHVWTCTFWHVKGKKPLNLQVFSRIGKTMKKLPSVKLFFEEHFIFRH